MFKFFILVSSLLLVFACSKKVEQPTLNVKQIGSLNYVEAETEDKKLLAQYEDIKITFEEVESKSRVLQEINQKEEGIYAALLYRMAARSLDEKVDNKEELAESYNLTIYTVEPEEGLDNLLMRLKINTSDKIKVSFVEPTPEQAQAKILSTFDGKEVIYDKLDKNHVSYIELQTKKNDEYLRQVKSILTRRMLFAEAKKNDQSVQDFINKTVVTGDITVTTEEVKEFMKSKNIVESEMTEQLTKSFSNILIENKRNKIIGNYIRANIAKTPIQVFVKPPGISFDVKTDWSPVLGSPEAAHSIYFFTNPNCSTCAEVEANITKALASNNYDVKLHTLYFYPEWDREARLFSEASMCAYLEDKSKFWDYHSLVSQSESKVTEANLYEFASQLNLNAEEFKSCVLQRKAKDIVSYHLEYTDYLGINSQPTIVIKGDIYPGVTSTSKLVQIFGNDFVKTEKPGLLTRIINYIKNIFA